MQNYKIIYAKRAYRDLDGIFDYIYLKSSLSKAKEFRKDIESKINKLKKDPRIGTPIGRNKHKLIRKPYNIYYKINTQTKSIYIRHIRHTSQRPLKHDFPTF